MMTGFLYAFSIDQVVEAPAVVREPEVVEQDFQSVAVVDYR